MSRWMSGISKLACGVTLFAVGCAAASSSKLADRDPEVLRPDGPQPTRDSGVVQAEPPGEAGVLVGESDAAPDLAGDSESGDASPAVPATRHPFHEPVTGATLSSRAPAKRLANLSPAACRAEAKRRKLAVSRDRRPTPGVATAFRVAGPIGGIKFRTAGRSSRFGVFDCRLALVFDEMGQILKRHEVTEVIVGTIYRPGSKLNKRVKSQHAHGLAADVVAFALADGRRLSVQKDWDGDIGEPVCGPDGHAEGEKAILLRNIVCDLRRAAIFHHILTPNYDAAHYDHFHFDIKRNGRRAIIR